MPSPLTVRTFGHVRCITSTGSGIMVTCTDRAHAVLLAPTIVLMEMMEALTAVAPFDEKTVIDRARVQSDAKTITIGFNPLSDLL